jgi:hypothetical protein
LTLKFCSFPDIGLIAKISGDWVVVSSQNTFLIISSARSGPVYSNIVELFFVPEFHKGKAVPLHAMEALGGRGV